MLTTIFLLIAFFRRKKFIVKDATTTDKVVYYVLNVALTPIFGPILYKWITVFSVSDEKHDDDCVAPSDVSWPTF